MSEYQYTYSKRAGANFWRSNTYLWLYLAKQTGHIMIEL